MSTNQDRVEGKLKVAAAFVLIGLAIQFVTLLINRPLSFMAFILIGTPFVAIGAVLYLWSILVHTEH